jgi:hypothetical protein
MSVQTTTKDVRATGATGTLCPRSGPYKCNDHPQIIVSFQKGATFTVCPAKEHATTWSMVRSADAVAAAGS